MSVTHLQGDCREVLATLPKQSVHCCVTSPPYFGLRDYGVAGQLGLEATPEEYIANMVGVFRAVHRVLRDDGTLWVNIGDSYCSDDKWGGGSSGKHAYGPERNRRNRSGQSGCKPKDLVGIPWMLAFALRADGWYLRQDIIWSKPNPMPESVTDRCTKAHEYIFLLSKSPRYFYDAAAIFEPVSPNTHARVSQDVANQIGSERAHAGGKTNGNMKAVVRSPKQAATGSGVKNNQSFNDACSLEVADRNKRSVWTVTTKPFKGAHFAVFPPDLIRPCIMAGTSVEGCCVQCGAPFERIVEGERVATRPANTSKIYGVSGLSDGNPHEQHSGAIVGNRDPQRHLTKKVTKGWRAGCDCPDAQPTPCTVLDPFGGSGTTGQVAQECGCHAILIELNADYIAMQKKRVEQRSLYV